MYAVGAFLSFTLAQSGMVLKCLREKSKGYRHKLLINALGAIMTGAGTIIVFVTKFTQGAWALAILIPLICYIMNHTKNHYEFVLRQLKVDNFMTHYHRSLSKDVNLCVVLDEHQ